MKSLFKVVCITLLFIPVTLSAKPDKAVVATSLSIIVPGGGQIMNKQYFKAAVISSAEIATAYYIYRFNGEMTASDSEDTKAMYKSYRNDLIWLLGGEIAYSAIDAFIDAKMSDMNKKIDISLKRGGIYLSYRF